MSVWRETQGSYTVYDTVLKGAVMKSAVTVQCRPPYESQALILLFICCAVLRLSAAFSQTFKTVFVPNTVPSLEILLCGLQ